MKSEKDIADGHFAALLLDWFSVYGRQLPWRDTRDPYLIWLSEIILQQTRIEQGRDYWLRFTGRWPTVADLAAASEDEVLREWQGLGYYARARNLLQAAREVVGMGGRFPDTVEGLRRLRGVGDYTAAAIASFAFGRRAAVVDGNVYRVLSRHFNIDTPINSTEGKRLFARLAEELLPAQHTDDYNQALMDFGALQCKPVAPGCDDCPLHDSCLGLAAGRVGVLPVKQKKLVVKTRRLAYVYIRCQGQTAIRQRTSGDIWQGLWEPVNLTDSPDSDRWAACLQGKVLLTTMRHVLTHRILLADFYLLETDRRPPLPDEYIWIDESQLDDYAIPRLVERLVELLRERESGLLAQK